MDRLFEPSAINQMVLPNRFIRSATWEGLATDEGNCTPRLIELVAALARGGVGLIINGHTYVHPQGRHSRWQLGIYSDDQMAGLQSMTRAVHENGGKIVVQLAYGGAYLSRSRLQRMSVQDIREVVDRFSHAAARAKKAGFDGVQIFAAHGFYLSQFLCPRYNRRTDAYGGRIENRARALVETLQAVRKAVGGDYPVLVKLNSRDFVENGLVLEDAVRVGKILEKEGIDAIELSGGLLNNPNVMNPKIDSGKGEAYFLDEAREFKKELTVPLILVGGIRSYDEARTLVQTGIADYISMSRPFICEPGLVKRWKAGDLRKAACISCNNCFEQIKKGEGVSCVPLEKSTAETFFAQLSQSIPASTPHPPGTAYRISIGLEQWVAGFIPVVKIQMEYNGEVIGGGLSFPLSSKDHLRVTEAITALLDKHAAMQAY
jgi:2,4-dienoyl-CoA reductase-like NADH-dependent reductase (Old Yellow Enzyme family)